MRGSSGSKLKGCHFWATYLWRWVLALILTLISQLCRPRRCNAPGTIGVPRFPLTNIYRCFGASDVRLLTLPPAPSTDKEERHRPTHSPNSMEADGNGYGTRSPGGAGGVPCAAA